MSGGSLKVNDAVWRALRKRLKELKADKSHVKVGVLGGTHSGGFDLVDLAAVHEFGSADGSIPARSFIASTMREKKAEIAKVLERIAKGIIAGKTSPKDGLGMLGLWAATAIKNKILKTNIDPPLKPETIARKGSSRPLVDTGQLVAAVTWAVVL